MFCELPASCNFQLAYVSSIVINIVVTGIITTAAFVYWYVYPTYGKWIYKTNPKYVSPVMVKEEIIQMLKSIFGVSICPTLSIWMASNGYGYGYCGVGSYGYSWLFVQAFIILFGVDFFVFQYHRMGHMTHRGWCHHKPHHAFYNVSPFSALALDYTDSFVFTLPMVLLPMIMPINQDLISFIFGVFLGIYGVYLHSGFELSFLSAHNYWISTPYQHYLHHVKSGYLRPIHTGNFFKIWDRMFGSLYDKKCTCAECCREEGKRTSEQYEKVVKPDYSVLLDWRFWCHGEGKYSNAN